MRFGCQDRGTLKIIAKIFLCIYIYINLYVYIFVIVCDRRCSSLSGKKKGKFENLFVYLCKI